MTIAYAHYLDGTSGWQILPKAFKKRASIGVQRAGKSWFWDYDETDTEQFMAALHKERLATSKKLLRLTPTVESSCASLPGTFAV
jgi:hypothetical protein